MGNSYKKSFPPSNVFLMICFVIVISFADKASSKTILAQVGSANKNWYPHLRNNEYARILSSSTWANMSYWPSQCCCTALSQAVTRAAPTPDWRYSRFTHKFSMTGRGRAVFLLSLSLIVILELDRCGAMSNLSSMTSQQPIISGRIGGGVR